MSNRGERVTRSPAIRPGTFVLIGSALLWYFGRADDEDGIRRSWPTSKLPAGFYPLGEAMC